MKRLLRTAQLLAVTALVATSCLNSTNYVEGYVEYERVVQVTSSTSSVVRPSLCATALDEILAMAKELQLAYNKTWTVNFRGESVEQALAADDVEALCNLEQAMTSLADFGQSAEAILAERYLGEGSFDLCYEYLVQRDRLLAKSEPVEITYSGRDSYGVVYAMSSSLVVDLSDASTWGVTSEIPLLSDRVSSATDLSVRLCNPAGVWVEQALVPLTAKLSGNSLLVTTSLASADDLSRGTWRYILTGVINGAKGTLQVDVDVE